MLIVDIIESAREIESYRRLRRSLATVKSLNTNKGTYLELTSNKIEDIAFLDDIEEKEEIITLNLWENSISDIGILKKFPNVEELYLEENLITSIEPILVMNHLQLLGLGQN